MSAGTKRYAVVGDPVAHSLSPLIHNRWMKQAGLDAEYSLLHLQSADAAADIRALAQTYSGLNVTLPHKLAALAAATKVSPDAQRVGAANTLTRENGQDWSADNTDVAGFSDALQAAIGNDLKGKRVVLIGAGGAARAAALYLARAGAMTMIVNRSILNAQALARDLASNAETADLAQLGQCAENAVLVVNSASLGHAGANLPALPAGKGRPFLDLSYGKAAESTLVSAASAGWTPHDGLRMLVGQAAIAFERWTATSAPIDVMRAAARAALPT